MKGQQQLLALCLLACAAGIALAQQTPQHKVDDYNYEKDYLRQAYGHYGYKDEEPAEEEEPSPKKHRHSKHDDDKVDDSYDKEYMQHAYKGYSHDDDDYKHKPECGPTQFDELKEPTCIEPNSGKCVKFDKDECVIDGEGWCKPVDGTNWACQYKYKSKGSLCRAADGVCDAPDMCTGSSATCTDAVKAKGTLCLASDSPCNLDAKCDGSAKTCPARKNIANGTPCKDSGSAEDGLYGEAYAEDGKVAMQSSVSAEIAKKHGWATCHRCFDGSCASFKFEWWNKKHAKHGKHGSKGDDYKTSDDKYATEEEEEWYESKVDTESAAKMTGYEPEIYCKKMEVKMAA